MVNLITALLLSLGVGLSSASMDHKSDVHNEPYYSYKDSVGLTTLADTEQVFNQNERYYFYNFDYYDYNLRYYLPSPDDLQTCFSDGESMSRRLPVQLFNKHTNSYLDVTGSTFRFDISNSNYDNTYDLIFNIRGVDSTLLHWEDNNLFLDFNFLNNIDLSKSYIEKSNIIFGGNHRAFLFYFSTYKFKPTRFNLNGLNAVNYFCSELRNNFFGVTSVHGVLPLYVGWFECEGIYYDRIYTTIIDGNGTKYYYGRLTGSSSELSVMDNTEGLVAYCMNVYFENTISGEKNYVYSPVYYNYDNTLSTYIDVTANGWKVDYITLLEIGYWPERPNGLGYDHFTLSWYEYFVRDFSNRYTENNNNDFGGLNNVFSLISLALGSLAPFLNIQILPFISVGMLLFLPLLFLIIFAIIKLFKR